KVHASRSAGVSRINQADGRIRKHGRLRPWQERKGSSLRVEFGRVVFVAESEAERKIFSDAPFVLHKSVCRFAANVGRRSGILEVAVDGSQQKIGEAAAEAEIWVCAGRAVACANSARSIEIEFTVHVEVVHRIVLIGRKTATEFPGVPAFYPSHRVGIAVRIVDLRGRTVLVESDVQARIEEKVGRARWIVGVSVNVQRARSGQSGSRLSLEVIVALRGKAEFVHQCGRKGSCVSDVAKVVVVVAQIRKTADCREVEGI